MLSKPFKWACAVAEIGSVTATAEWDTDLTDARAIVLKICIPSPPGTLPQA
jgi:hypothetical protein